MCTGKHTLLHSVTRGYGDHSPLTTTGRKEEVTYEVMCRSSGLGVGGGERGRYEGGRGEGPGAGYKGKQASTPAWCSHEERAVTIEMVLAGESLLVHSLTRRHGGARLSAARLAGNPRPLDWLHKDTRASHGEVSGPEAPRGCDTRPSESARF